MILGESGEEAIAARFYSPDSRQIVNARRKVFIMMTSLTARLAAKAQDRPRSNLPDITRRSAYPAMSFRARPRIDVMGEEIAPTLFYILLLYVENHVV